MYIVEIWNEQDYEQRYDDPYASGVEVLLDSEKELKTLINLLIYSRNVFTVRNAIVPLVKE